MKELSDSERGQLAALIEAWDLPRALVTLVDWSLDDDPAGPEGQQQIRLKAWSDAHAGNRTPPPDADSLRELASSRPAWEAAPVIDLLRALESLFEDEWPPRGTVHPLVRSVSGTAYYIVRKAPGSPTRADRQPHTVPRALERLYVVAQQQGRMRLELMPLEERADALLRKYSDAPTGYVVHFENGFELCTAEHPQGIQVQAIKSDAAHLESVLRHLEAAGDTTFLVYPECTLPAAMRLALGRAIALSTGTTPRLTLAGSFHDPQPDRLCLNRTALLDHRGAVVLTHVKTATATLRSSQGDSVAEYIDLHNTMHALVTSLGLVGVAICAEFSNTTNAPLAAWSAVGPRWMLVPSMGERSTVDMHVRAAKSLRDQHRTTTLISNQSSSSRAYPGCIVTLKGRAREECNKVTSLPLTKG